MRPSRHTQAASVDSVTAQEAFQSVGRLGLVGERAEPIFLGTTFGFRSGQHFLSAAHCVGDLKPHEVIVEPMLEAAAYPVVSIERHPTADLALLELSTEIESVVGFSFIHEPGLGEEFTAVGFPEDVMSTTDRQPTLRVFHGHIQRVFTHHSHQGHQYQAVEMSIAAPAGLSGGPLTWGEGGVIGVVAENFDSTTYLEITEEVNSDLGKELTRHQRVISYGVAVNLEAASEWIEDRVPSREAQLKARQAARRIADQP